LTASNEELVKIEGVSEAAIVSIKTVQEGSSRLLLTEASAKPVLNSWLKLLDYCRARWGI